MSRSRKKTPITGMTTAESDKAWKQSASRKVRRTVRQRLLEAEDGDAVAVAAMRYELINPASSAKDGKQWLGRQFLELMRK
jgi:hypothetical protein